MRRPSTRTSSDSGCDTGHGEKETLGASIRGDLERLRKARHGDDAAAQGHAAQHHHPDGTAWPREAQDHQVFAGDANFDGSRSAKKEISPTSHHSCADSRGASSPFPHFPEGHPNH